MELLKSNWNYTLTDDNGKLILSVLAGTVGLYEIDIELNNDQVRLYQQDGKEYIDKLANDVRDHPGNFDLQKIKK